MRHAGKLRGHLHTSQLGRRRPSCARTASWMPWRRRWTPSSSGSSRTSNRCWFATTRATCEEASRLMAGIGFTRVCAPDRPRPRPVEVAPQPVYAWPSRGAAHGPHMPGPSYWPLLLAIAALVHSAGVLGAVHHTARLGFSAGLHQHRWLRSGAHLARLPSWLPLPAGRGGRAVRTPSRQPLEERGILSMSAVISPTETHEEGEAQRSIPRLVRNGLLHGV